MDRTSVLVLEDKQIYGINKIHKNVLKPVEDSFHKKVINKASHFLFYIFSFFLMKLKVFLVVDFLIERVRLFVYLKKNIFFSFSFFFLSSRLSLITTII